MAGKPFVIYDSDLNRESSALPYFASQKESFYGMVDSARDYKEIVKKTLFKSGRERER